MNVGKLRHLVTLENPGPAVPDGDGGYVHTYTALAPQEWAEIKPASARDLERVTSGTVMTVATHLVRLRYRADVGTQTRVAFGTRRFSVTGVTNPDERNIELVLACVEVM